MNGKIIEGVEVKFESDNEIVVKSNTVASGYFNLPFESKNYFKEGWFYTGDIGELKNDILLIKGRKKNLSKLKNGIQYDPERLECALESSKIIENVWIYGDLNREFLVAVVISEKKENEILEEIIKVFK